MPYFEQPIAHKGLIDTRGLPGVNLGPLIHFSQNNTTDRQLISAATPAAAAWSAAYSAAAFVPAGAKAILVRARLHATATATATVTQLVVWFSDNNSSTPSGNFSAHAMIEALGGAYAAGAYICQNAEIIVLLNSSLAFYIYTQTRANIASDVLYAACLGYYMGG